MSARGHPIRKTRAFHDADGLTPQMRAFADCYLGPAQMDPTAAYRMAYPEEDAKAARTKGARLAEHPKVLEYLDTRKAELHAEVKITQAEWLRDVIELRDMCMGRKKMPMATFYEGELVSGEARKLDSSGAKHALELLGRHLGVFNDKLKLENTGGALFVLNMGGNPEGNTYDHEPDLIEADTEGPEEGE